MKKYLFSVGITLVLVVVNCGLYKYFKNIKFSILIFLLSIIIAIIIDKKMHRL